MIIWGYRMWWQRRPTRADRRALAVPRPLAAPGSATHLGHRRRRTRGLALAWALPLFGIPLVAFLAIDLAVGGALQHRRTAGSTSGRDGSAGDPSSV